MNVSDARIKMFGKIKSLGLSALAEAKKMNMAANLCKSLAKMGDIVVSNTTYESQPVIKLQINGQGLQAIKSMAKKLNNIVVVDGDSLYVL